MNIVRESIFVSALRAFCNALFAMIGVLIGLFIIIGALWMHHQPFDNQDRTQIMFLPDANGDNTITRDTSVPIILKIDLEGIVGTENINDQKVRQILWNAAQNPLLKNRVKGILLNINTPGGSAFDSDLIYRQLKTFSEKHQVKIYTYVNGLCASGGVYIASASEKIYSFPAGIYGSVGVKMGPTFNVNGFMQKMGVRQKTVTSGEDKDFLNPFKEWPDNEKLDKDIDFLQDISNSNYEIFVDIVTKARPNLDKEKLINDYGAKIFIAKDAMEKGFIDGWDYSYEMVLAELATAIGVEETEKYQVAEIIVHRPLVKELFSAKSPLISGKIKHEAPGFESNRFGPDTPFLYLYE